MFWSPLRFRKFIQTDVFNIYAPYNESTYNQKDSLEKIKMIAAYSINYRRSSVEKSLSFLCHF